MKVNTGIFLLVVFLGFSAPANSTLIDRGTGMIYDTALEITWYDYTYDSPTPGIQGVDWYQAITWVSNLTIGDTEAGTWRLPHVLPVDGYGYDNSYPPSYDGSKDLGYNISAPGSAYPGSTGSEMAYLYYVGLANKAVYDTNGDYQSGWGLANNGPFQNLQPGSYWSETVYTVVTVDQPMAWGFCFNDGSQNSATMDGTYYNMAMAVRDGDYGPSVSTSQTYRTDYLTLGDTFTFDYWWEMGIEPTEPNLDVLFFNGENWETFGLEFNFGGSSEQWETSTFWVPPWARGETTRIMFSLFDGGQQTDPTVYLRNIGSASAPVPEPSTIFLMGLGLVALVGLRKKN